jgi:hypothetical protein
VSGQSPRGVLRIAPISNQAATTCAPGLCGSAPLSFRIDSGAMQAWPKDHPLVFEETSIDEPHRATVYRAEKAQQSFFFRFSDYRSHDVCLFLNDLYWTAQLWETHSAPWCRKSAVPVASQPATQ